MNEFLREVQEDMEREKYRLLWQRYGKAIIGLAAFAIVMSISLQGYKTYTRAQAEKATDALLAGDASVLKASGNAAAIALLQKGDAAAAAKAADDEGLASLAALRADAPQEGPSALAAAHAERRAYQALEKGDVKAATSAFNKALGDSDLPASARTRIEGNLQLLEAHSELFK